SAPNAWPRRRRSDKLRPASMPSNTPPPLNQIPLPHPTPTLRRHLRRRCQGPFPTDASKVAFAASFMQDYAATWCQPYLNQIFNGELLDWTDFLKYMEASFFDHNRHHQAKVALRNIRQTRSASNYTQDFNQHSRTTGWPDALLMSLYQNGLKENFQLAVLMSNIQFDSPVHARDGPESGPDHRRHPTSPPHPPSRP
ncbi:uncharacterized protein VP01_9489g1, partial [Puccinia sorghi]